MLATTVLIVGAVVAPSGVAHGSTGIYSISVAAPDMEGDFEVCALYLLDSCILETEGDLSFAAGTYTTTTTWVCGTTDPHGDTLTERGTFEGTAFGSDDVPHDISGTFGGVATSGTSGSSGQATKSYRGQFTYDGIAFTGTARVTYEVDVAAGHHAYTGVFEIEFDGTDGQSSLSLDAWSAETPHSMTFVQAADCDT